MSATTSRTFSRRRIAATVASLGFVTASLSMVLATAASAAPMGHVCVCEQFSLCKVKSGPNVLPALPGQEFRDLSKRQNGKYAVVVNGKVTKTLVGSGWKCNGLETGSGGKNAMDEHMQRQRELVVEQEERNRKAAEERRLRIEQQQAQAEADRQRRAAEQAAATERERQLQAERAAAEAERISRERTREQALLRDRFEAIPKRLLGTQALQIFVAEPPAASAGSCAEACLGRNDCRSFSYSAATTRVTGSATTHCLLYARRTFGAASLIAGDEYTHYDRAPEVTPSGGEDRHLYDAVQSAYEKYQTLGDDCVEARNVLYSFPTYWDQAGRVPADKRYTVRFPRETADPTIADLARDRYLRFREQMRRCLR